MNTDGAKALLMKFNSAYPFDDRMRHTGSRLYVETIQSLLDNGFAYKSALAPWVPGLGQAERVPVSRAIEAYAFHNPDYEPVDINPAALLVYEAQIIAELLRNPPAVQPNPGGFTQADMDAAEVRGYERCKADVARLRA